MPRGEKVTKGKGWKPVPPPGKVRFFKGSLLEIFYFSGKRFGIFRVF